MNTLKNWGIYGFIAASLLLLAGCGQVSSLTTGADETKAPVTTATTLLSSTNNEWTLVNGLEETLAYTNTSNDVVTLTFSKIPLSGKISYTLPNTTERQDLELGVLSSLSTYTLARGETQTWVIEGLPENATDVVLTLFLIVNNSSSTEEIQLRPTK